VTFADDPWQLILNLYGTCIFMAVVQFFPEVNKIGRIFSASLVSLLIGTLTEHTLFR
jgi:hypothetical protein